MLSCSTIYFFVRTESSDGEKRLYADLLSNSGYNEEIRPRRDPTQTVVVDLELDLNHLIKLVRRTFQSCVSGSLVYSGCHALYIVAVLRICTRQCTNFIIIVASGSVCSDNNYYLQSYLTAWSTAFGPVPETLPSKQPFWDRPGVAERVRYTVRSRPLKYSYGSMGSAVSSPSGVWGGVPAEIEFGAF